MHLRLTSTITFVLPSAILCAVTRSKANKDLCVVVDKDAKNIDRNVLSESDIVNAASSSKLPQEKER